MAIQMKLMHMVGFKTDLYLMAKNYAQLTVWLPDWYLVEGNNEQERIEWCRNYILKLYHEYDPKNILDAFHIWLDTILKIQKKDLLIAD